METTEMTELWLFFFNERAIPRWATYTPEEEQATFLCHGFLPKVKPELERLAERHSFWGVLAKGEDRAIIVAHEGFVTFIETDEDFEFGLTSRNAASFAMSVLLDMVTE